VDWCDDRGIMSMSNRKFPLDLKKKGYKNRTYSMQLYTMSQIKIILKYFLFNNVSTCSVEI